MGDKLTYIVPLCNCRPGETAPHVHADHPAVSRFFASRAEKPKRAKAQPKASKKAKKGKAKRRK